MLLEAQPLVAQRILSRGLLRPMDPPEVTGEETEVSSAAESWTSTESFVLHHLRGLQIQISRLHRMQLYFADRFLVASSGWRLGSCLLHVFSVGNYVLLGFSGPERESRDSLESRHPTEQP